VVGVGLSAALGQQIPKGIEAQELARVDAGENCPGYVLCMRRATYEPGASIPMRSHKDRPEVGLVMKGTLTNTLKRQSTDAVSGWHSHAQWSGGRASACQHPS
jgi:quercetin dioxygenase-like cupin family protein